MKYFVYLVFSVFLFSCASGPVTVTDSNDTVLADENTVAETGKLTDESSESEATSGSDDTSAADSLIPAATIRFDMALLSNNTYMSVLEWSRIGETLMIEPEKVRGLNDKYRENDFYIVHTNAEGQEIDALIWQYSVAVDAVPGVIINKDVLYKEPVMDEVSEMEIYPLQIVAVHNNSLKKGRVEVTYYPFFKDIVSKESDDYVLGEMLPAIGSRLTWFRWVDKNIISYDPNDIKTARALFLVNQYDPSIELDRQKARLTLEAVMNLNSIFQSEIETTYKRFME